MKEGSINFKRAGFTGTLGIAVAMVAAGCSTSERSVSSYRDRITYVDIDRDVTLTCYSDGTKKLEPKKNPTNIAFSLKSGFCPDKDANKQILGSEETHIGEEAIELPNNPIEIFHQQRYIKAGATVPPPFEGILFSDE